MNAVPLTTPAVQVGQVWLDAEYWGEKGRRLRRRLVVERVTGLFAFCTAHVGGRSRRVRLGLDHLATSGRFELEIR